MYKLLLNKMNNYISDNLSDESLDKLQKYLVDANIYIKIENFLSLIIVTIIITLLIATIITLILNLPIILPFFITLSIPLLIILYIQYNKEKRLEKIEQELPDYLKQVSSLLKVGLGLESAFDEISKTTDNDLNKEIKRALIETSFGKSFDEALLDTAKRNNSENLENTFRIMIHSKESGGDLADILDSMAKDLSETISLKKERKTNVMMSVMFLLISSIIATPFSLGMIGLYSDFIGSVGRTNPLAEVIPTASIGYISIQAILVSILIGIVLYSNAKKGIKYMLIILPASLAVYVLSQIIFRGVLGV